jgi:pyridoxal phosphate enzyme (YggS family)
VSGLAAVRRRIEEACARAGREAGAVRLVAVSKSFPAERVRKLLDAGHTLFGENRVQEALAKIEAVGPGASWHLVGPLQRNKARHAVGAFELIHAVDGEKLAAEIDRRAAAMGVRQQVLLQLNLAEERTKAGVRRADLAALADAVARLEHVDLRGLMTIPPAPEQSGQSRRWFAELRELRDALAARLGRELPELSMGMTDDFEVAVEEGATLVRVGRAIFGERE